MSVVALLISLAWFSLPLWGGIGMRRKFPKTSRIFIGVGITCMLAQTALWVYQVSGMQTNRHYRQVQAFLSDSTQTFAAHGLDRERGVIALSYMGEGLAGYANLHPEKKDEIQPCIRRAISLALREVAPGGDTLISKGNIRVALNDNALFLSHLNILLNIALQLSPDTTQAETRDFAVLHREISEYLAAKMQSAPHKNIRSYAHLPSIWPADNALTLHSLYLYDRRNGTSLSKSLAPQWLEATQKAAADPKTGLFISELTGASPASAVPRGGSTGWTIKYLSAVAPEAAQQMWARFGEHFRVRFGVGSLFREFPDGSQLTPDYDAGPVWLGIGGAASGMGVCAARYSGDELAYWKAKNMFTAAEIIFESVKAMKFNDGYDYLDSGLFAAAVQLTAETHDVNRQP